MVAVGALGALDVGAAATCIDELGTTASTALCVQRVAADATLVESTMGAVVAVTGVGTRAVVGGTALGAHEVAAIATFVERTVATAAGMSCSGICG